LPKAHNASRISGGYRIRRDVGRNHRTGSYHRTGFDVNTVQNDHAKAKPNVIFKDDPALGRQWLFANRCPQCYAVVMGVKGTVRGNLRATTYLDTSIKSGKMASVLDVTAFSNPNTSIFSGIDEGVAVKMHVIFKLNRPAPVAPQDHDIIAKENISPKAQVVMIDRRARRDIPVRVQVSQINPSKTGLCANGCQAGSESPYWTQSGISHPKARPGALRLSCDSR
jgi:hypothetical protein